MTADDFKSWDAELAHVAHEIAAVAAEHGRAGVTNSNGLTAKKVAVIQKQINLERTFDRIAKLTQRDFMLMPRERAIVHWATHYLEVAGKRLAAETKNATRTLWLRLVQARLSGPIAPMEAGEDDLVSLAVRQTNLAKTETYLAEALVKLKRHKADLRRRYEALGVVDANHVASGTLRMRLGATTADALGSPTLRSLEAYFRLVTAPVSAPSAAAAWDANGARAARKTDGLLNLCKNLVLSKLRERTYIPGTRTLEKLESTFQQLDDLEEETREAYDQIMAAPAPEPTGNPRAKSD